MTYPFAEVNNCTTPFGPCECDSAKCAAPRRLDPADDPDHRGDEGRGRHGKVFNFNGLWFLPGEAPVRDRLFILIVR